MWERTLTVSSSGKTFSCTGWKVGWIYGAAHLVTPIMLANQWIQFSVSTPAQRALVEVLEKADQPYEGFSTYYDYIRHTYERKRNYLVETLQNVSLTPVIPQGGFFVMANISNTTFPDTYLQQPLPNGSNATRDWGFARWLTIEVGVTPIPPTSFYTAENRFQGENLGKLLLLLLSLLFLQSQYFKILLLLILFIIYLLARFAFCKTDECLLSARNKLYNHFLPTLAPPEVTEPNENNS